MEDFASWFAMGGYATYVWSSYALAFALLGFNVWSTRRARKVAHCHLQQWFKKLS